MIISVGVMPDWLLNFLSNIPNSLFGAIRGVIGAFYRLIPDAIKNRYNLKEFGKGGLYAMALFVVNILRSIYFLVAVPALIVTYKLFVVLKEQGIIDNFKNLLNTSMSTIINISNNCFPLITNLKVMLSCINQS